MINEIVGKYKITRLIGEGGMAAVYEAEHKMLGTKVAIKVLNSMLSRNAQIKERFRNEAKLMASLDHPNITKVIDFDEQPQQLSIIMEYLKGEDLDDKIKRTGPLSDKEITAIFTQTLSAFQYAHEKGIVHRDIKPSNIFILPNGNVKILDFGIAKLFGQGNEMTQTGTQIGTPLYMSPEQVKADKSIDHRSDIYSIGVTMFFAINGKSPYNIETDSQFDIFNKIVHEPLPDISNEGLYNQIILKACMKNRDDRFQQCNEITDLLTNSSVIEDKTIRKSAGKSKKSKDGKTPIIKENNLNEGTPHQKTPTTPQKTSLKFRMLLFVLIGLLAIFIGFKIRSTDESTQSQSQSQKQSQSQSQSQSPTSTSTNKKKEASKVSGKKQTSVQRRKKTESIGVTTEEPRYTQPKETKPKSKPTPNPTPNSTPTLLTREISKVIGARIAVNDGFAVVRGRVLSEDGFEFNGSRIPARAIIKTKVGQSIGVVITVLNTNTGKLTTISSSLIVKP